MLQCGVGYNQERYDVINGVCDSGYYRIRNACIPVTPYHVCCGFSSEYV